MPTTRPCGLQDANSLYLSPTLLRFASARMGGSRHNGALRPNGFVRWLMMYFPLKITTSSDPPNIRVAQLWTCRYPQAKQFCEGRPGVGQKFINSVFILGEAPWWINADRTLYTGRTASNTVEKNRKSAKIGINGSPDRREGTQRFNWSANSKE